ncbi:MAG: pre-peptidase C-terminal domain-containing protein [Gemmataceae bacterium]
MRIRCWTKFACLSLGLMFASDRWVNGQPPPVAPNPQAPTLNMPAPMGMQRGTKLDLTLTGTNLADPTGLWTSFPAKAAIPTDNNNGKDNGKLRVQLEVPGDAQIGFHSLRLATGRGMSNFRLFCIDDLPQVQEVETNNSKTTPQAVPIPCTVAGRTDAEKSDYFKVTVKVGQRVSFEVLGHRLGSPFDPEIRLFDPRNGRELTYSNDAPGLQTDARLTYTFKDAGDYVVEIRDVTYRGGPDYFYRLRIGDFPCATAPVPLAAKRGSKVSVNFAGPNVEGVAPVEVTMPTDAAVDEVWVAPKGSNGLHGWPVALLCSDHEEALEQEPNNEMAKANRIAVPGGITGRFVEKNDLDYYVFAAKKGQRLTIQGDTLEVHTPTLLYMVLKDAKGAELTKANPQAAPPADQRIDFTPPADGDYYLEIQHLNYVGGPNEVYRITVAPYEPGFDISLGLDRYDIPQTGDHAIPINLTRRDYPGPIDVSVVGPTGITGQTTIAAGAPKDPKAHAASLPVHIDEKLPVGPQSIKILGKATINGKVVTCFANQRGSVSQALANLSYPPRFLFTDVALAVTQKPPFTLAAKFDQPEALRGSPAGITITATRAAGFTEEIAVTAVGVPANVAPTLKNIPKDQNEVKVQLTPAANAAIGSFPLSFTGKAKFNNRDFSVASPPTPLIVVLPFDLKVEALPLKLAQGGKAKVKVTATRKAGYKGTIALELRNLPANVTAPKATLAGDQTSVEIEVTAAESAAPGDKADVNVLGTAPEAANQQNASANFTVSIQKK